MLVRSNVLYVATCGSTGCSVLVSKAWDCSRRYCAHDLHAVALAGFVVVIGGNHWVPCKAVY